MKREGADSAVITSDSTCSRTEFVSILSSSSIMAVSALAMASESPKASGPASTVNERARRLQRRPSGIDQSSSADGPGERHQRFTWSEGPARVGTDHAYNLSTCRLERAEHPDEFIEIALSRNSDASSVRMARHALHHLGLAVHGEHAGHRD